MAAPCKQRYGNPGQNKGRAKNSQKVTVKQQQRKSGCQFSTQITQLRPYKSVGVTSLLYFALGLSVSATNIIHTVVCSGTNQQSHLLGKPTCQLDYLCSGIIHAMLRLCQSVPDLLWSPKHGLAQPTTFQTFWEKHVCWKDLSFTVFLI